MKGKTKTFAPPIALAITFISLVAMSVGGMVVAYNAGKNSVERNANYGQENSAEEANDNSNYDFEYYE